jgi:uncharacterized protein
VSQPPSRADARMSDATGPDRRRVTSLGYGEAMPAPSEGTAAVSPQAVEEAGRVLAREARTPARVILFGSHAAGKANAGSDLDFLVIERDAGNRHEEAVRLRRALPDLGVPVDVIVVGDRHAEEWGHVYGTVVHSALSRGRVLHEPA